MHGRSASVGLAFRGFTLIEMMLVIMIVGILFQFGLPRIFQRTTPVIEQFSQNLNALTERGRAAAIEDQLIYKVQLDLRAQHVELIQTKTNSPSWRIQIPAELEVEDFLINNKSQFIAGSQKETAFFFIRTDGTTQYVRFNIRDTAKQSSYMLELNPFTGRFTIE